MFKKIKQAKQAINQIDQKIINAYQHHRQNQLNEKLLKAVEHGEPANVKKYLAKGADCNVKHKNGLSALMIAVFHSPIHPYVTNSHEDIFQILLKAGADVNAKKNHKYSNDQPELFNNNPEIITALMLAAYSGNSKHVQWLLQSGADINVNKDGIDACRIALGRNTETFNLLQKFMVQKQKVMVQNQAALALITLLQVNRLSNFTKIPLDILREIYLYVLPDSLNSPEAENKRQIFTRKIETALDKNRLFYHPSNPVNDDHAPREHLQKLAN